MKTYKICVTFHAPGVHKLIVEGITVLSCKTEIELVAAAKRLGIYFKDLDCKYSSGTDRALYHNWFGNKDTMKYLNWKGTLGFGTTLRNTIEEHNNASISS